MPGTTPECNWCATDPATERFHPISRRSDVHALMQRVEALRERGSGYVEVSRPDGPFPVLTLSFAGDHGVVHQFTAPGESLLLRGDDSVSSELLVEVPVLDEMHPFTGDYVSAADRALGIIERFVAGGQPAELGDWETL